MKKTVLLILTFWLAFHFILPYIAIEMFLGDLETYGITSSYKGFGVNLISISIAMLIIYKDKSDDFRTMIAPSSTSTFLYFVISLIISIVYFVSSGGAEGVLAGASSGEFISYLSLLFDVIFAIYYIFFFSKNKVRYPLLYILSFVIFQTMRGNRSGVLHIVLLYIYLYGYQNFHLYSKLLKRTIIVIGLASPMLFVTATQIRSIEILNISKMIVGRMSMIELSSIPLDQKDNNTLDWRYFDSKYGLSNQLKQTFNSISPIDPFEQDVFPDQYYRSIFLGVPESFVRDHYTSMNLTLPVFFVLLTRSYFLGILLTILFIVGYYKLLIKNKNNVIFSTILIVNLYQFLYFFDFPMLFRGIFFMGISLYILRWFDRWKNKRKTVAPLEN